MRILDYFKESIKLSFREFVKDLEKELMHSFSKKIYYFKKQIIKELMGIMILLISITFLGISIVFLLIEYLNLTKTLAFGIIGIILLIIGIIIKAL